MRLYIGEIGEPLPCNTEIVVVEIEAILLFIWLSDGEVNVHKVTIDNFVFCL